MERLQIEFKCQAPAIDESQHKNELPSEMAVRLAEQKALAIARKFPNSIIIGADQVGELEGQVLGKPHNYQSAVAQLRAQSGRTSKFHCGISVVQQLTNNKIIKQTRINTTEVSFRDLQQQQIENYLRSDQPYDCAGSFKAEGLGISLFTAVKSNDPSSLVGLPLIELCSILAEFGVYINNNRLK
jgi:septum formation protein